MTGAPKLNVAVTGLAVPPIAAAQAWSDAYDGHAGPLIDLSQAVPGYPPHDDLLGWLSDAAGNPASAGYGAIEGEPAFRKAYARHLSERYDADINVSNVCVTAGCNQAFAAAIMAVAGAGDSILLMDPFYFNHDSMMAMLGIRPERVACHAENGFVPSIETVEQAMHAGVRAIVLISPNNPTGAIYPPELVADIYELCRQRSVWLLIDETYRDFLPQQDTTPHGLFKEDDWPSYLIQLYSFSKSFCIPGHRLGAITAGEAVVKHIAKVMDNLQICAPRPAQIAITKALPALADWREQNRREILKRADAFRVALAEAPAWHIQSLGAYFAYVSHPFTEKDSLTVAEDLAKLHGVSTLPGEFFGDGQGAYLRMAFANADCDTIATLGSRLAAVD